ncbi:hypothetical protein ACFWM5_00495 [Streptomyces bobili]|uniref:hypothetical protein n=1 Tax=Streptomyces bobili TaxID=67280 RepID=UPI00365BE20A
MTAPGSDQPLATPAAVRVNEVVVNLYTSRDTANWWALFRARGPVERFTIITASIPGDLVDVACDDHADAEWLRYHMIEMGIPTTALRVLRGGQR